MSFRGLSGFGSLSLPTVSTAAFMMVALIFLFSASRSPSDEALKVLNLLALAQIVDSTRLFGVFLHEVRCALSSFVFMVREARTSR